MTQNFLSSCLQNISFGIILQVIVRIVTFISNACVLRYISKDALGLMNVRLLLLESTILFLSREAFRMSCYDNVKNHNWPLVFNLIWLTVPLACTFSFIFGTIWLSYFEAPPDYLTSQYKVGVYVIAISCIVEILSEAPMLVINAFLFNKIKVILNLFHLTIRTMTFMPLVVLSPENAVYAFSTAQLTATTAFSIANYAYFYYYFKKSKHIKDKLPFSSVKNFLPDYSMPKIFDVKMVWLTWSLFKTMIVKQLLTEGEKYVMTICNVLTLTQQGVYDIVNSLGTLPARLLLRPIEENFYFYFAQLFKRGQHVTKLDQEQMKEASTVIYYALKCIVSFGLTVFVFGLSYSKLLLFLYGGEKLTDPSAPTLLRAHSAAIILLAVNGITEAFGQAAMDKKQLEWYNYIMIFLSVIFLTLSWGFTKVFGGLGFIIANCCNMALRICYNLWFIHKMYKGSDWKPLKGLFPGTLVIIALLNAFIVTSVSEAYLFENNKIIHLSIGAFCFYFVCHSFYYEESHTFINKILMQRSKSDTISQQVISDQQTTKKIN